MNQILIIDDSAFAVRVLADILKDTYDVICASNGEEGVRLARECAPSLIMLDIEMPGMDGFEVLKILKDHRETEMIPVVFLTAIVDSEYEERGFLCGAVDYIRKPYNRNVVKVRVQTHVNLAEYRKQIERQLNIDTLTGVYNRRGLEGYKKEAAKAAVREKKTFTYILFDIDYFKRVNDSYGHLQGDHVLKQVASILKECVSVAGGYVARIGGEEFSVAFCGCGKDKIDQMIHHIYEKIREAQIPNEKSETAPYLTISAGGAGKLIDRESDVTEILRLADKMLYRSKENGRNRFTWYEETEESE